MYMSNQLTTDRRRVYIGARIDPKTLKYLNSLQAPNVGRAIDKLVIMHRSIITAMQNRSQVQLKLQKKPAPLDL